MMTNDDRENKQNSPQQPHSELMYVALPGHPLYGRQIRVVKRRISKTYTNCQIEDPGKPGFSYQIRAMWLSLSPPPPKISPILSCAPIYLPLSALDRMVQMILTQSQARRMEEDDEPNEHGRSQDLGSIAGQEQEDVQRAALLPGSETGRRYSP